MREPIQNDTNKAKTNQFNYIQIKYFLSEIISQLTKKQSGQNTVQIHNV